MLHALPLLVGAMSKRSGSRPIVQIHEVRPRHWIAKCDACPKREMGKTGNIDVRGKVEFSTHNEAYQWWERHSKPPNHIALASLGYVQKELQLTPEEIQLREIFSAGWQSK